MRHFRKTLSTLCLVLTILPVPSLSFNYINIVYVGSDSVNGWSPTSTCQAFEGGNDNATCTDSRQTCQGAGCERGVDNVTCTDSRPTCQACGVDNARTCPDSRPWCTCGGMEQDVNDSLCYELEEVPATENLFEYCACRLGDLGYDVVLRDPSDSMVMSSCCGNSVQLAEVESRIAYGLRNFSNLLSRTIVGVYVRSYRERRQCWVLFDLALFPCTSFLCRALSLSPSSTHLFTLLLFTVSPISTSRLLISSLSLSKLIVSPFPPHNFCLSLSRMPTSSGCAPPSCLSSCLSQTETYRSAPPTAQTSLPPTALTSAAVLISLVPGPA